MGWTSEATIRFYAATASKPGADLVAGLSVQSELPHLRNDQSVEDAQVISPPRKRRVGLAIGPGAPSGAAGLREHLIRADSDVGRLQHCEKFLFEGTPPVVFGLVCDVTLDRRQVRWADAECAIPFLPSKSPICFTHPAAGVAFQRPHNIGQFLIGRKYQKNVKVVCDATDRKNSHSVISSDRRYVVPQPGLNFGANQRDAFLGTENDVKNRADVGMRHASMV